MSVDTVLQWYEDYEFTARPYCKVPWDGPYTYAWSFGDGNIGTGNQCIHAYVSTGIFDVVVTAHNLCTGEFASDTKTYDVREKLGLIEGRWQHEAIQIGDPADLRWLIVGGLGAYNRMSVASGYYWPWASEQVGTATYWETTDVLLVDCEILDLKRKKVIKTAPISRPRVGHILWKLKSGNILCIGGGMGTDGRYNDPERPTGYAYIEDMDPTCEIFDIQTYTWKRSNNTMASRVNACMVESPYDGQLQVWGMALGVASLSQSMEIYKESEDLWRWPTGEEVGPYGYLINPYKRGGVWTHKQTAYYNDESNDYGIAPFTMAFYGGYAGPSSADYADGGCYIMPEARNLQKATPTVSAYDPAVRCRLSGDANWYGITEEILPPDANPRDYTSVYDMRYYTYSTSARQGFTLWQQPGAMNAYVWMVGGYYQRDTEDFDDVILTYASTRLNGDIQGGYYEFPGPGGPYVEITGTFTGKQWNSTDLETSPWGRENPFNQIGSQKYHLSEGRSNPNSMAEIDLGSGNDSNALLIVGGRTGKGNGPTGVSAAVDILHAYYGVWSLPSLETGRAWNTLHLNTEDKTYHVLGGIVWDPTAYNPETDDYTGSLVATNTIDVYTPPVSAKVTSISPPTAEMRYNLPVYRGNPGSTITFSATVTGGTLGTVTWHARPGSNGTIDSATGLYTFGTTFPVSPWDVIDCVSDDFPGDIYEFYCCANV